MNITGKKYHIAFLFLLFLIPLNIYRIGNNLGSGIQWALFHYQQTVYGSQVFTVIDDLGYVSSGLVGGKSAVSLLLWSGGAFLLIAVLAILIIAYLKEISPGIPGTGLLVILSGFLFLFSCMAQYGVTFHGPAGFCIPIGIPVVWAVGIFLYRNNPAAGRTADVLEGAGSVPEPGGESEAKRGEE